MREEVIGECRLILGDCREVLPSIDRSWGAVVTDPPYGIGFRHYSTHKDDPSAYADLLRPLRGRAVALLQYPEEMMRLVVPVLGPPDDVLAWVYPSNLPRQFRLWGLWNLAPDFSRVPQPVRNPEASKVNSAWAKSYDWWEQPQVKNTSPEKEAHPCQIPVSSVERVLRLICEPPVVDPFMGSGTTGVACARRGVPFVGIEVDPDYFDIACRRIEEAYKQPRLFAEPRQEPKQEALF